MSALRVCINPPLLTRIASTSPCTAAAGVSSNAQTAAQRAPQSNDGVAVVQMRHMHGSTGPLSHELYLAPEVRMWDHLEPAAPDGGLRRPAGDAEVLATDIWTLGVVFWQFLTLHLFGTLGAIPAVRARDLLHTPLSQKRIKLFNQEVFLVFCSGRNQCSKCV